MNDSLLWKHVLNGNAHGEIFLCIRRAPYIYIYMDFTHNKATKWMLNCSPIPTLKCNSLTLPSTTWILNILSLSLVHHYGIPAHRRWCEEYPGPRISRSSSSSSSAHPTLIPNNNSSRDVPPPQPTLFYSQYSDKSRSDLGPSFLQSIIQSIDRSIHPSIHRNRRVSFIIMHVLWSINLTTLQQ